MNYIYTLFSGKQVMIIYLLMNEHGEKIRKDKEQAVIIGRGIFEVYGRKKKM